MTCPCTAFIQTRLSHGTSDGEVRSQATHSAMSNEMATQTHAFCRIVSSSFSLISRSSSSRVALGFHIIPCPNVDPEGENGEVSLDGATRVVCTSSSVRCLFAPGTHSQLAIRCGTLSFPEDLGRMPYNSVDVHSTTSPDAVVSTSAKHSDPEPASSRPLAFVSHYNNSHKTRLHGAGTCA
jgi:hypothetical protein